MVVVSISNWKLNPRKKSNTETLNILQGPMGKQPKTPLTITKWQIVRGSHIQGTIAIPGKPCDEAYLTWGGRVGPSYIPPRDYDLIEYLSGEFCRQKSNDADTQKIRQQKEGHIFNREAESRVCLTKEMVLNPKNYGDAYLPPKR